MFTEIRIGELYAIQWKDIDLKMYFDYQENDAYGTDS